MLMQPDPNADLIGFTYASNYRGRFDFTTTVTETAPWNSAYVNVRVERDGKIEESSRRAEHVRLLLNKETNGNSNVVAITAD